MSENKIEISYHTMYQVEYFEVYNGGGETDQFGEMHNNIEDALFDFFIAKRQQPSKDWYIRINVTESVRNINNNAR